MTYSPDCTRLVAAWPCESVCLWERTGEEWPGSGPDPMPVFSCEGCGSEWVRTELWTPVDAHGIVPEEVLHQRELALRERVPPSA